jgi:hypothetical protein
VEELWERAPTAEKDLAGGFLEEGRLLDDMVFEVLMMPSLRVTLDIGVPEVSLWWNMRIFFPI